MTKLGSCDACRISTLANSREGMALSDTASKGSGNIILLFHCLFYIFLCTFIRAHPSFLPPLFHALCALYATTPVFPPQLLLIFFKLT